MPLIDLQAVRLEITIQQVLNLLQFAPTARVGPRLRGPCPVHGSRPDSRCFTAHLHRHRYRCFVCHSAGTQLDLWAAAHGLALPAAAVDLCRQLGRPVPWLSTD